MHLRSVLFLALLTGCNCSEAPVASTAAEVEELGEPAATDETDPPSNEPESSPNTEPPGRGRPTRLPAASAADARAAIREGRRLARDEDYVGALAAFDRALEILPGAPRVRCETGYLAHRAGLEGRAARDLDIALALLPEREGAPEDLRVPLAMCLYNRGLVYEAMGQPGRAADVYLDSMLLRSNRVVSARLQAARAARRDECRPPRPALGASDEEIETWFSFEFCQQSCDADDEGDEEDEDEWEDDCPSDCWATVAAEDDTPRVEGAMLMELGGEGCQVETVGRALAIRGEGGWFATELCSAESATTDGFYRAESTYSCDATLSRPSPSVVMVDLTSTERERYGDMLEPPPGTREEDDPGCSADHSSFRASHILVVCRADGPTPRCAELQVGERAGGGASVFCEDSDDDALPEWAAAQDTYAHESDEDAYSEEPVDDYQLTFEGNTAVLTRAGEGSREGPAPGRYSLDELFALLGEAPLE